MRMPTVNDVLGPRGLVREALPDWESRPAQVEMAEAIATALEERRALIVEAGTGTGKTLAYLVPALLSGLKVVISTGTKNLQEQVLQKDVPTLRAALPFPVNVVVLKGISNYLCKRRFAEHALQLDAPGFADPMLVKLRAWAEETQTGDRAELSMLPDDSPLWHEISSTSETRLGQKCPHFEECFVTRARRAAQAAELVVVNHHLFFADLALKASWPQAQLLPPYEAVIFDEAHQVEDVVTDYFSTSVSTLRVLSLVRETRRVVQARQCDAHIAPIAEHVQRVADQLFEQLRTRLPKEGRAHVSDATWTGAPTTGWHALDTALEELEGATSAERSDDDSGEAFEATQAIARRARLLRDDLAFVAERAARDRVYWGETRGRGVFLHASPVDVSDIVRERVVAPIESVVFTSATLSTGGRFDFLRARLGLEAAGELRLESPFDYRRQALLYVPRDLPEPSSPDFVNAVADRMEELVRASRGRAFLLFTSHRALNAVARLLEGRLEQPMLVQGERPKRALLDEFRARPSVLLATQSFWEGVDVVGDALQLVAIDKLPFAPPDDPLVAARCRRLEEAGHDPFGEYSVPQAALQLAQGFGRLIRHRADRGVVALLDRRAATRAYGQRVLSSLPRECRRTHALADVQRFFAVLRQLSSNVTTRDADPA